MADLNVEWGWMLVGFVIGIGCSWFVSDLVYPAKDYRKHDEEWSDCAVLFIRDRVYSGLYGELTMNTLLETQSINLNTTEKVVILMGLRLLAKKQDETIYKKLIENLMEKISE